MSINSRLAGKKFFTSLSAAMLVFATSAFADEGGVSVWIPGFFGSLAAVPGEPGWSLATVYYHSSVDAGKNTQFPIGGRTSAGISGEADLFFAMPSYTFETPVFGGQAATALVVPYGHMDVEADVELTGPRGNTFRTNPEDKVTATGDLLSLSTLKWHDGVNNFLTYAAVAIPVGDYEKGRLANTSTNHWGIDLGGGYTYLDMESRNEFSATLGFTYNFENSDTDYKNGVDGHFEWAASHFIDAQTHVGLVGYFFHQVSGDSGDGAVLGDFKARVAGAGPQLGHFFVAANRKFYVNAKGYYEFDAANRPSGWSAWLSVLIPLEEERKH